MPRQFKISKQELQRMLDQAADQAVAMGVALAAQLIKSWLKDLRSHTVRWLIEQAWKPALLGLLILVGWFVFQIRSSL